MKIAICNVQEFNPTIGGVERVSVALAENLIDLGLEVIFIACRKSPYSGEYTLPAKQLFLPNSSDYNKENVVAFAQIIKDENIDILINQNSHSELYNQTIFEAKDLTQIKLISVLHFSPDLRIRGNRNLINFQHLSLKNNIVNFARDICTRFPLQYITMYDQRRMFNRLYEHSDKVVLLSKNFRNSFKKIAGIKESSKLTAINNMLSFPYKKVVYQKKKQILFCGRMLFSQKRPDRMLYIWQKLQDRLPDWNLLMIGDGSFYNDLIELSNHLKLKRIDFLGFKDPVEYYKESSIFCMTSNHEGWGLVLTEAMQFGCVPIAFNSFESITDIIEDGKNGYLVKPFDLDEFADKIFSLIINNKLDNLSKSAIESIENLSPRNVTNCWIGLFKEIIGK